MRLSAGTSRAEALKLLVERFRRSELDDPGREARLTVCAAANLPPAALIAAPEAPLGGAAERLEEFAMRRVSGEPLSKIVGRREFWGLALSISPDVLDPRPETETIVEAAIALFAERRQDRLRVLDLGVGSGALLCALLHEFVNARGLGVDISAAAAEVARRNAAACGLAGRADIHVGTWADGVVGPFDLIVSNPPYVRTSEIESLSPEIRNFDPRLALDGGIDGLDAYRVILPAGARLVAPDGWLIIEAGAGQAGDVLAIAAKAGFLERSTRRDLAGVERVVVAGTPRSAPGRRNLEGDNRHERVIASE
ncbi:MAG TPA: peptide chain release factor N(5)-glutamine methyltransferase [Roseiarcus sp.]|nr:peptide chain release factor N(5)-glutamine methyltransferase [Roseiarcus sp.]